MYTIKQLKQNGNIWGLYKVFTDSHFKVFKTFKNKNQADEYIGKEFGENAKNDFLTYNELEFYNL